MKLITSAEPITFKVTSSRIYNITSEGVAASDADAAVILDRLGFAVTITTMDEPTIVTEEAAPEVATEPAAPLTPEPMPTEVVEPTPTEAA